MLHHRIIGTGTPVIVLHGVTLDLCYMMDIMEPGFRGSGNWKRIYVDMPGHGQSPGREDIRSQDDLLNTVLDFVNEILPDEPFALVGLSRGSYIARGLMHFIPDRILGMALIVPGGNPSANPARLPPAQVIERDASIRPELFDSEIWAHENLFAVQRWDIVEKRRQIVVPGLAGFDVEQEARVKSAFDFSFAEEEEATTVTAPSLIVVGRQDSVSGYLDGIDLMHRYPRATLAVLDTAGHGLAWDRPEVFQALVRDWLVRLPRV